MRVLVIISTILLLPFYLHGQDSNSSVKKSRLSVSIGSSYPFGEFANQGYAKARFSPLGAINIHGHFPIKGQNFLYTKIGVGINYIKRPPLRKKFAELTGHDVRLWEEPYYGSVYALAGPSHFFEISEIFKLNTHLGVGIAANYPYDYKIEQLSLNWPNQDLTVNNEADGGVFMVSLGVMPEVQMFHWLAIHAEVEFYYSKVKSKMYLFNSVKRFEKELAILQGTLGISFFLYN